eukprot:TRINITY_DN9010_c0_g1_i1.p1 TRINITY_DN9010_c0_g1~~TRINITY_DN9010_c0_g1_i1.p1  ORF type:complete len:396 (-),score=132.16 TRINITY_DN9010_c0_g1_i1:118-1305(-)
MMEYCAGGALNQHIKSRQEVGPFATISVCGYMAQLSDGLAYIHSQHATHRDLKSENVMVTAQDVLKISDFGCGKTAPEDVATPVVDAEGGDMTIVPPEFTETHWGRIPQPGEVSAKYDVWGLGCIFSELLTLKLLKEDRWLTRPLHQNAICLRNVMADATVAHKGALLPLLEGLLQPDPEARLSAPAARQWVSDFVGALAPQAKDDGEFDRATTLGLESHYAEAWAVFGAADTDHSQFISVDELRALLRVKGIRVNAEDVMARMDANHDGRLCFHEFLLWWAQRDRDWTEVVTTDPARGDVALRVFGLDSDIFEALRAGFVERDFDSTGVISVFACYTLIQAVGVAVPPARLYHFLTSFGANWSDTPVAFDTLLHWTRAHVDWAARELREGPAAM